MPGPHVAGSPHILIIEDDAAIGDMLTQLLELEGYRVTWCRSAAAALAFLVPASPVAGQSSTPDLIVLDLALGTASGVTLLQRVASLRRTVPPVVLVSAADADVLASSAMTLGAAATLRKPFTPDDLLQLLATVAAAAPDPYRAPDTEAFTGT